MNIYIRNTSVIKPEKFDITTYIYIPEIGNFSHLIFKFNDFEYSFTLDLYKKGFDIKI